MDNNKVFKESLGKLERYCDYQERCSSEVVKKLISIEVPDLMHEDIILYLNENGFLDDKRYAATYASGKFNHKRWGRRKIYAALRVKRIDSSIIHEALSTIDDEQYYDTLVHICDQKQRSIGGISTNVNKKKLLNFATQRGFESSLVWQYINENKT